MNKNIKSKIFTQGKLMLFGEHSVVYGYECIASTVNLGIEVEAEFSSEPRDIFHTPESTDNTYIKRALFSLRSRFPFSQKVIIRTKSDITGYGLGSSSAVTVAVIKAVLKLLKKSLDKKELFNLCYLALKEVYPRSSGFDLAASIYSGTILFNGKSKETEKISEKILPVKVVFTGIKADTADMVNTVFEKRQKNTFYYDGVFKQMNEIVRKAKQAVVTSDYRQMGELMNENHLLLKKIGVSTQKIDSLIFEALYQGAQGAKLSGAGGGDCMIYVSTEENEKRIKNSIEKKGGKVLDLFVG